MFSNKMYIFRKKFDSGDYDYILKEGDAVLKKYPLDRVSLFYTGVSYLYKSINLPDDLKKEKNEYRENAIMLLRKYLLLPGISYKDDVYYVLGLAYYYKGYYFRDIALKFLEKLYKKGKFKNNMDYIYYYTNLYSSFGEYSKSNDVYMDFLQGVQEPEKKTILYISIAKNCMKMNDLKNTELYLNKALEISKNNKDKEMLKEVYFLKAEVYTKMGELEEAQAQYKYILSDVMPNSLDAMYMLSEVFSKENNEIESRAMLRKILKIDPEYKKALLKLYKYEVE